MSLEELTVFWRFIVQREDENSKNEANSEQLIEIGDAKGNQKSGELGSSESQETEENQPDPSSNSLKRKKKDRGQNKKRPRTVPLLKRNERLCPSLARNNATCDDKEKCQFIHDIQEYLKNKPADIGEDCINFKLTGKCPYGLECRFAKCHISDDLANIIDYEKYDAELEESRRKEIHHQKDLQISLRKRKFQFPKSAIYLKRLNEGFKEANVSISQNLSEGGENIQLSAREKKKVDFADKLYLAPLTTVGNLPFRRICKKFGADITCGEMAMATNLLQGQQSEWALVKRHHTEDVFGVQLCGSFPDTMSRCAEMLSQEVDVSFIDVNIGCPIDFVFKKGGGCALMGRLKKFEQIVKGMVEVSDIPITVKMRTGIYEKNWTAHDLIPKVRDWGASLVTLHGRSREQRYTRFADWEYINQCADLASPMPLYGNGDILSFEDANLRRENTRVSGIMIARGALIKPWIFTEIKEQRHWDISASERFDILKDYTNYGLEHWGSDTKGVENTRRFLLEWLSFLHRYIPVGLLEVVPQKINARPPQYFGRNDLETLMASSCCRDWIKISEMLLGPVPANFDFLPKHKANSYN